jgi:transposase
VALAELNSDMTIVELVEKFKVHPNQNTDLKGQLLENGSVIFRERREKEKEPDIQRMQAKIGQLT